MDYRTGIILLAAGASRRLGQPKQSLLFRGTSLLQYSIDTALASTASKVVVVLGAMTDAGIQQNERLDVVINSEWEEGMASSIRYGLKSLMAKVPDIQSAVFMACDQPYVDKELLNKLITLQSETGKKIVASAYGDTKGIPAIFSRDLFPELLALKGDKGARSLIRNSDGVSSVPFPTGNIDIDTAADYAALQQKKPG